ncbi:GldG family protein [Clostridium sp. JS66]|uniref:GldG family protein n=1 Tax=Clostridium sp. JS66 TaxID=3064705 RepID=UPI00298D6EC5|nr:GldG family protein [Clostridium sp. JS66]WPC44109.1 GldG family protein [Clostridium sp. JS66]
MKNIKSLFNSKKSKKGSIAVLTLVLALAVLIGINLGIGKLNWNKDLTKSKMFTLSDQSYKILDNLKQDVTIYGFYKSGQENYTVKTILDQYAAHSKHVKILYRDPSKYPQLAQKFNKDNSKVDVGSIVVENGSKFKVLDQNSFLNSSASDTSNPSTSTTQSLAVEQNITSGILYVTSDKSTIIYTLQGQGEGDVSSEISKQLSLENYTVQSINLSLKDASMKEDSILLVVSPKRDLSQPEANTIKSYLSKGGKALFLMDVTENDLPNFQAVLNSYGVSLQRAVSVEGDNSYVSQNPIYLLPEQKNHDIMNSLITDNLRVLIPGAQSIQVSSNKKSSLTIDPLLTTTSNSWGKTNLKSDTLEKQSGDLTGPFNIAVAVTDKSISPKFSDTRIVVVANATFTNSQVISLSNNANLDFLMNSISWAQGKKDSISVRPKNLDNYTLQVSALSRLTASAFAVVVIPGVILIVGIVVWARRRKL